MTLSTEGFKEGDRVIVICKGESTVTDRAGVHANRMHAPGMRGTVVEVRSAFELRIFFDGVADSDDVWADEVRVLNVVEQVGEVSP